MTLRRRLWCHERGRAVAPGAIGRRGAVRLFVARGGLALVGLAASMIAELGEADPDRVLHLANRPEFIAADTVQKFEAETGITVTYDIYPGDEAALASLTHGNPGQWDLVVLSADRGLGAAIDHHLLQPIDRQHLVNAGNLDPEILAQLRDVDPENRFGIPYLWGSAGLAVNTQRLDQAAPGAPADSLALLFDPVWAARAAACGIVVEDDPDDLMPSVLSYLGFDPYEDDPKAWKAASERLHKVAPYLRHMTSDEFADALASGTACVGFGASVDVADARSRAEEREAGVELSYAIPRERARRWIDVMAVPASARDVPQALAFIDFILRPEIVADITDWTGAANPNLLAAGFVDDADDDETIFPSSGSRARLFMARPLSASGRAAYSHIWSKAAP